MKRIVIFTFFTFIIFFSAKAQTGSIAGHFINDEKRPLSLLDIMLSAYKDSAVVSLRKTDSAGRFKFTGLPAGEYKLYVSAVNYKPYTTGKILVDKEHRAIDIGDVTLINSVKELKEVMITSKKPLIENLGDKLVVNLQNSPFVGGRNTLDALQLAPGVFVDNDNNIKLRGKSGVLILLDGKPTHLSQEALSSYLKSLPANTIDKIEIITQPSAKYEASGVAGIINIKTIKIKQIGFNGSINLGAGYWAYPKTNEGVNLNYRLEKLNIYGNYNHSNFESYNNLLSNKVDQFSSNSGYFNSNTFFKRNYVNQDYKIGTDYYVNKNSTVSLSFTGNHSNGKTNDSDVNSIGHSATTVDSVLNTSTTSPRKFVTNSAVLSYQTVLDTLGGELNFEFDHSNYKSNITENFASFFSYPGASIPNTNNLLTRSIFPTEIKINEISVDFAHALAKKLMLEAGFKLSRVNTQNNAVYDSLINDRWVNSTTLSNNFNYKENILAGYVTFNKKFKKTQIRLGVRIENTDSDNQLVNTGEDTKRNYTDLFPNIFINEDLSPSDQLSMSFNRRINRPSYQDLNPFKTYTDKFSYKEGNPFLAPQYSTNFNITYLLQQKYSLNFNYSVTNHYSAYVLETDTATKSTSQIIENIATLKSYAINLDLPIEIEKWWNSNLSFTGTFNNYSKSGKISLPQLSTKDFEFLVFGSESFSLPKEYNISINGYYISRFSSGYYSFNPQSSISLAISKTLMEKRLSLSANISDIFYDSKVNERGTFGNTTVHSLGTQESRVVYLSLSYRFGGKDVRQAKQQKNSQEAQRIKSVH